MHVAEKGQGPVILFLHGFPEIWYTWRHQILALSSLGYHTIAPDLRGYGDTEAPVSITSYSCMHIVGDLVALVDALGVDRVFLVAHDWGAIIGWYLCLFRPDRVKAFEPGKIEAEIVHYGTSNVLKRIISSRKPGPPCMPKDNAFNIKPDTPIPLPSWFSEDDLSYYTNKFNQKGFTGALNYYRAFDLTMEWCTSESACEVHSGRFGQCLYNPGVMEYVENGDFKGYVPLLDEVVVMEGVGHFINQERADEINSHILDFIKKF
ncbi:multicystatin-like [Hibiscus syriacus]|uniref:Multicystatin-like n=1 Tax=Hibiscus syriacus TaxID=106335 RepID=A0A6A2YX38_HIBSY|nr:multicystatin-like [Hibiscus syriacus]